jgi:hypothetical protein
MLIEFGTVQGLFHRDMIVNAELRRYTSQFSCSNRGGVMNTVEQPLDGAKHLDNNERLTNDNSLDSVTSLGWIVSLSKPGAEKVGALIYSVILIQWLVCDSGAGS